MDEQEFFEKFAELAIRIGVNLQPDQELAVWGDVEHAALRALGESGVCVSALGLGGVELDLYPGEPGEMLVASKVAPGAFA
jgi:hypothetical protein